VYGHLKLLIIETQSRNFNSLTFFALVEGKYWRYGKLLWGWNGWL